MTTTNPLFPVRKKMKIDPEEVEIKSLLQQDPDDWKPSSISIYHTARFRRFCMVMDMTAETATNHLITYHVEHRTMSQYMSQCIEADHEVYNRILEELNENPWFIK